MTIHIIYRHTDNLAACGVGKNRPKWFSFEGCLNNILSTIEDTDFVKFHLMYDGELKGEVDKRIDHVEIVNEKSAMGNWVKAWDYAKSLDLKDGDLIYHLENDYLHRPSSSLLIQEVLNHGASYCSLYDHPDKYVEGPNPEIVGIGEQTILFKTNNSHWKYTNSTTGTFACKQKTIKED
jgi:hypothetical protein